jgi:hypothetical protein
VVVKHALALVLLVACNGEGIEPSLRFSTLEDDEVTRVVSAALGGGGSSAIHHFEDNESSASGCPSVTRDEQVTTLVGGCMTPEGFPVSGVARRVLEPNAARYEFEAFVIPQNGAPLSFDGVVELAHKHPPYASYEYRDQAIDLVVVRDGLAVRSTLRFTCDRDLGCSTDEQTFQAASNGIELVGRGGALVAGHVHGGWSVDMTIQGADTLQVFMVKQHEDCMHWRIVGTDRMIAPFGCPR